MAVMGASRSEVLLNIVSARRDRGVYTLWQESARCMMTFVVQAEAPPLREDGDGALRVGDTRVLLEMVVRAFEDGATAETIVQRYSALKLSDVYAVIAYYLRHRSEVDGYMRGRDQQAAKLRRKVQGGQKDLSEIRGRLQAKRKP